MGDTEEFGGVGIRGRLEREIHERTRKERIFSRISWSFLRFAFEIGSGVVGADGGGAAGDTGEFGGIEVTSHVSPS